MEKIEITDAELINNLMQLVRPEKINDFVIECVWRGMEIKKHALVAKYSSLTVPFTPGNGRFVPNEEIRAAMPKQVAKNHLGRLMGKLGFAADTRHVNGRLKRGYWVA
jgi:hypothetical protein